MVELQPQNAAIDLKKLAEDILEKFSLFGRGDDDTTTLKDALAQNVDSIKKFYSDPQTKKLYVQKITEGEEGNCSFSTGLQPANLGATLLLLELVKHGDDIKTEESLFGQLEFTFKNRMGTMALDDAGMIDRKLQRNHERNRYENRRWAKIYGAICALLCASGAFFLQLLLVIIKRMM